MKRKTDSPSHPPEIQRLCWMALSSYYNALAAGEPNPSSVVVEMKDGQVFTASSLSYESGVIDPIEDELKRQFVIAYGPEGANEDYIAERRAHTVKARTGRRRGEARTPILEVDGVMDTNPHGASYDPN
jgi:hypothetical protein